MGSSGPGPAANSFNFVTQRALDKGLAQRLGVSKQFRAIEDTRGRGKSSMLENNATPEIDVDPETFTVEIGGKSTGDNMTEVDGQKMLPKQDHATALPMAQRYFLF